MLTVEKFLEASPCLRVPDFGGISGQRSERASVLVGQARSCPQAIEIPIEGVVPGTWEFAASLDPEHSEIEAAKRDRAKRRAYCLDHQKGNPWS